MAGEECLLLENSQDLWLWEDACSVPGSLLLTNYMIWYSNQVCLETEKRLAKAMIKSKIK